jgi:leucine-rich repeat protein SHOC2
LIISFRQKNFEESIEQCKISKNPTLILVLEMNSNESEIPNSISALTHLHTFKLFGYGQNVNVNSITSLHNQIQTCMIEHVRLTSNLNDKSNPVYTLTKLQHLELIRCEISELNETISNLTSLQTLLFSNNFGLKRLPSSMTKLTSLLHLSLDSTNIQSDTLISVVCKLPSLQVLELNWTKQLETLPSQISQLTSLQHLSLSYNGITSLPTQVGLLTQLHTLNLDGCFSLSILPTQIGLLSQLRVYNLSNCQSLNSLPTQIGLLTQLHTLNLDGCFSLSILPTQIGLLTQLHTLNLYCCYDLNNIPTELEHLTNLREFSLYTTQINKFLLKMKNWIKLEVLELNNLNIEAIPSEVWTMTKLRHLSLSCNKLSFIPSELYCLSNLTHLNLSSNQIIHISNQINKLTQLQFLNLSSNQLTEFPDDISSLLHLSELWIYNNKLNQFSSQLPPNLVRLNLDRNSITSISSTTLSSLTQLQYLNLSDNQITTLPTQIGLLTSLQELNLNNNDNLSFIPSDLVSEKHELENHCFLNLVQNSSNCLFEFVCFFVLELTFKFDMFVCG